MRIVVCGLAATYPLGGVSWDYLAYVDGFRRLGHDVLYLEDTGAWFYDPAAQTFCDDPAPNLRYLRAALATLGLDDTPWSVRAPDGTYHGGDGAAVAQFCRAADLFLNVSGCCWLRDEYRTARRVAYVDTDPGFTQATLWAVAHDCATEDQRFSVNLIRRHDRFFTFAEHIGATDCRVPDCGIAWRTTRQPVVLERWPYAYRPTARRFTTVLSWRTERHPPVIDGVAYGGKDVEFLRFAAMPSHTRAALEVAVAGAAPRERLAAAGWHVADAHACSRTMAAYQQYLSESRGEWSIAKEVYVALRSGWFSTRSAFYLAAGKPVVVEDTGWSAHYPTGAGLFAFSTMAEAAAALEAIEADYRRHCEAARAVAAEELAAARVLERLLADVER
jgi:glycosyltransferase involved in cell wall biosynthesis